MNKVLKLQRVGLITPTVVEYEGKVLATNHLDIESLCNLWRVHFGFYTTERVDLAMTKKQFSSIQQKTLSSVKSVYELFYERNFIPREFEANEEHTKWGMYRNKELEKLEAENAALRERLEKAVELPCKIGDKVYAIFPIEDELKILDGTFVGIEEVVSDFKGCMCAIIVRQAKDGHYFNTYWVLDQFNKTWWADKEIVESKLAEVMGNNEM